MISPKLLVVDDEPAVVSLVSDYLTDCNYEVCSTSKPREALSLFANFSPDVAILDFRMPEISGSVLFDEIKKLDSSVEVMFLTGQQETGLAVSLMKKGAIDYLAKPVDLNQLDMAVTRALDHRRLVKENEGYRLHLEDLVAQQTVELRKTYSQLSTMYTAIINTLATALDYRDQSTSGHSQRVARLTTGAARQLGISGEALVQIEHGALLHDVGKLRIPDSILWKPDKLTDLEWKLMRKHTVYGYEFLRSVEFLAGASDIVYAHHEKFDGSGYPRKLKGEEIPFGARLFAIVDAIDALIYEWPYHAAISFDEAASEVRRCAGTHFDPQLTEPVLEYLGTQIVKTVTV